MSANMLKQERVAFIDKRLQELYPNPPVPLDHSDPYTLLVAVLLSAQCTDERVNLVTPALFALADNPLSEILINEHGGEVPQDFESLERLPGVGHKTASVVMAQSFGVPSFPVDTHIHRLAQRWGLTRGRNVNETERDLKRVFKKSRWNDLHLQIIFYGREFCSARGCDGRVCEICTTCYPTRKHPKRVNKP